MVSLRFRSLGAQQRKGERLTGQDLVAREDDEGAVPAPDDVEDDTDDEDDEEVQTATVRPPPPPPVAIVPTLTHALTHPTTSNVPTSTTSLTASSSTSSVSLTTSSASTVVVVTVLPVTAPTLGQAQAAQEAELAEKEATATTTTSSLTSSAIPGSTDVPRLGQDLGSGHGPPPDHTKVGIVFGVLAPLGLIVGLIWAAMVIRRRRQQRGLDNAPPKDYPASIGRERNWPAALDSLPFFNKSTKAWASPTPSFMAKTFNRQPRRTDSSIMNEALSAAYHNERTPVIPQGYLNEKIYDKNKPLPLLEPAPVAQASIRKSLVSWLKRSSRHHPLRLNPMADRLSSGASSTYDGRGERSYSVSHGDMEKHGGGVPPMPAMPALAHQGISVGSTPVIGRLVPSKQEQQSIFSREDASAYYKSLWTPTDEFRVSQAPSTRNRDTSTTDLSDQHMSVMSGYTATTMYGGERSSVNQNDVAYAAGLTPPSYMMVRPPVPEIFGAGTGLGINAPGVSVGGTSTPDLSRVSATGAGSGLGSVDSLYALYTRSAVGLPVVHEQGKSPVAE